MRSFVGCGYLSSPSGYVVLNNFTKSSLLMTIIDKAQNSPHSKVNQKGKEQNIEKRCKQDIEGKKGGEEKIKKCYQSKPDHTYNIFH